MKVATVFALLLPCAVVATRGVRVRGRHIERDLQKDDEEKDDENESGLIETHPCEPNPQVAIDYVTQWGMPEQGDQECLADPVNACGGGCCRYSVYFICDTSNTDELMPCVCNANTANSVASQPEDLQELAPLPEDSTVNATNVEVVDAPTATPMDDFPQVLATEEVPAEEAEESKKKEKSLSEDEDGPASKERDGEDLFG